MILAQAQATVDATTTGGTAGLVDIITQGGVPALCIVAVIFLVRHILKEREECKKCRAAWHARERKLETRYSEKVEALLRDQIDWQKEVFGVAEADAEEER